MKTLMILGAGIDQLPAYEEAKQRGYRVIGIDGRHDAPGIKLADTFHVVSTRNVTAILRLTRHEAIAGIIAPASDASQMTLHQLCTFFGTPTQQPLAAASASMDKGFFLELLGRLGLPVHTHFQSNCVDELIESAANMRLPMVVKPSDASGSKGMTKIQSLTQLSEAIAVAKDFCDVVILEEWIEGSHYSAEFFLQAGEIDFAAFSRKELGGANGLLTAAHNMPAGLEAKVKSAVLQQIRDVIADLGMTDGPMNIDFIVDRHRRVHLIEMAARSAGNGMLRIIRETYGVDLNSAAISLALGEQVSLIPTTLRAASLRVLHSEVDGVLQSVEGLENALLLPETVDLHINVAPGDAIKTFSQSANKLGYITLVAETEALLQQAMSFAVSHIRFNIHQLPGECNAS